MDLKDQLDLIMQMIIISEMCLFLHFPIPLVFILNTQFIITYIFHVIAKLSVQEPVSREPVCKHGWCKQESFTLVVSVGMYEMHYFSHVNMGCIMKIRAYLLMFFVLCLTAVVIYDVSITVKKFKHFIHINIFNMQYYLMIYFFTIFQSTVLISYRTG